MKGDIAQVARLHKLSRAPFSCILSESQTKGRPDDPGPSDRCDAAARSAEAARHCGADRTRGRLRRYRHQPPLWLEAGDRRRRRARTRNGDGCGFVDHLGSHPDRRAQIRHSDPARRQSRRRRHRGAARAARCKARSPRKSARLAAHRRPDRGCAALWRRRDHAGDLGALRRRRSEDRRARTCTFRRSGHDCDPRRSVPCATQGNGVRRQHFWAVMLVWFVAIALLGIKGIFHNPAILGAISPHHAVLYLSHAGPGIAFAVLGAAFLTLTGGEAMYADMGHFGRLPIQLGWFAIVFPALALNYLGQGGLLLADPHAAEHPFYLLVPRWAHYPMVGFATVATVIASQAIISGAYSLTQQAMQLGFLPRMRVLHTASHEKGQIYIPVVNWLLAAGTLAAVLLFGSSDALGGAYGIAVSMLMAVTTVLAALVALKWGYNPLLVVAVNGFFFVIELVFVAANMTKLIEGGWFPLLLASVIAFLMLTWRAGWQLLDQERSKLRQREDEFIEWVIASPPIRLPGAAAIFTAATTGIPLCLTHHLKHNRVMHERVLFIASVVVDAPRVEPAERVKLVPVGAGITRVIFYFGFMETPDVMNALRIACQQQPELRGIDPDNITYYFRRVMVIACDKKQNME